MYNNIIRYFFFILLCKSVLPQIYSVETLKNEANEQTSAAFGSLIHRSQLAIQLLETPNFSANWLCVIFRSRLNFAILSAVISAKFDGISFTFSLYFIVFFLQMILCCI